MKNNSALSKSDLNAEISATIQALHQAEQRLEHLTSGEIDSVTDASGRIFLLQRAQETLRQVEASRQAAILNALPARIALLDEGGTIVSTNDAWRQFAADHEESVAICSPGSDYLTQCPRALGSNPSDARQAADGIRAVLAGTQASFSMDYSCHSAVEDRWFLLTATPLVDDHAGGAVVMHIDVTAEKRTEENLRASESKFRQMAESISDVFFLENADDSKVIYVSPSYEQIWGKTCASLYAQPESWAASIHPDDRENVRTKLRNRQSTGINCEYRMIRSDNTIRWIHVRTFPVINDHGTTSRVAGIATDITVRKAAESRIACLNRVYAMLGGINMLIVRARERDSLFREACRIAVKAGEFPMCWIGIVDRNLNRIRIVASEGLDEQFLTGLNYRLSLSAKDARGNTLTAQAVNTKRPVVSNDSQSDPKVLFGPIHAEAGIHSIAILPLIVADEAVGVLVLYAREIEFFHDDEIALLTQLAGDIAFAIDHIDKQDQLEYIAYYDLLTGLANQRLFLDRVAQYRRSALSGQHKMALCFVDLEHFKNFNDTYGQSVGDALLKQVAQWLIEAVGDASYLARIGADKFAVVLPNVTDEDELSHLLEKTTATFMEHPFRLNKTSIRIAAKVGVAIFPDDGDSADTLFMNAEVALKKAKVSGDRYLFYAQKMTETVAGRLTMVFRLRQALENGEFLLHYQPKVNLATRKLVGAEALLRWNDAKIGLIAPARFIPILEETGLIFDVGRWAMLKALEDYLGWCAAGLPAMRIAVNVSPLQLRNRGFVDEIHKAVSVHPQAARGLELEITESVIMRDVERTITSLRAIREMGVSIAIDDFGTGFSSLSYLAKLPIDTLKIDRSFVTDMSDGPDGLSLVSAIINLAHSLKLNVVAEGVETEEQSRLLKQLACDEMQGYLISRPVPANVFEAHFLTRPA